MHIHEADLPMETQQLATDALVSWAAIYMKAQTDADLQQPLATYKVAADLF